MRDGQTDILYGINPITEALKVSKRKCFRVVLEGGKINPSPRSSNDTSTIQKYS